MSSTRRSSRVLKKVYLYEEEAEEEDIEEEYEPPVNDDDEPAEEEYRPPIKKRQKQGGASSKGPKKHRGMRGKLQQLTEFPLDVLFEIFSHLDPFSLLKLSRCTKDLRNILMSRSTAFVWRTALDNVEGLPDVPSGLNEPQFVRIVFDSRCFACSAPNIKRAQIVFRTRLCKFCLETSPKFRSFSSGQPVMHELLPTFSMRGHRRQEYYYSVDMAEKLQNEHSALQDDQKALSVWRAEKRAEKAEIQNHASLCEEWAQAQQDQRSLKLEEIRDRRKNAIQEKLVALGWGLEIDWLKLKHNYALSHHKLVSVAKDLTDRGWTNIESTLVDVMTEQRAARLQEERQNLRLERRKVLNQVLDTYLETLPHNAIGPQKGCLANLDAFKTVFLQLPLEKKLTLDMFPEALAEIPAFCKEWRTLRDLELMALMPTGSSVDTLSLATTSFLCNSCRLHIRYPMVLIHKCLTPTHSQIPFPGQDQDPELVAFFSSIQRWPIQPLEKYLTYATGLASTCEAIIRLCEKDPLTTTLEEMDELNPLLESPSGKSDYSGQYFIIRWQGLVRHHARTDYILLPDDLIPLAEAKEQEAIENYVKGLQDPWTHRHTEFGCGRCNVRMRNTELTSHLKESHTIEAPTIHDRVYLNLSTDVRLSSIRFKEEEKPKEEIEAEKPSSETT
ncbi:hypothetical protein C8J56DRAFT_917997 [Mycena floridula]|nr:hypothetical protein C8J56DRAFT_917997 [Mycena floridula]